MRRQLVRWGTIGRSRRRPVNHRCKTLDVTCWSVTRLVVSCAFPFATVCLMPSAPSSCFFQGPPEGHIVSGLPEIQTLASGAFFHSWERLYHALSKVFVATASSSFPRRRQGQQFLLLASDGIFGFMWASRSQPTTKTMLGFSIRAAALRMLRGHPKRSSPCRGPEAFQCFAA